jgi:hypothetical protein
MKIRGSQSKDAVVLCVFIFQNLVRLFETNNLYTSLCFLRIFLWHIANQEINIKCEARFWLSDVIFDTVTIFADLDQQYDLFHQFPIFRDRREELKYVHVIEVAEVTQLKETQSRKQSEAGL